MRFASDIVQRPGTDNRLMSTLCSPISCFIRAIIQRSVLRQWVLYSNWCLWEMCGTIKYKNAPRFDVQSLLAVEVLPYVHRNRRLIRDGTAQDGHLDFHTAPELCLLVVVNRLYIALFSALEQIHCAFFLSFFLSFFLLSYAILNE